MDNTIGFSLQGGNDMETKEKNEQLTYVVEDYIFADEAEADVARSELKKIEYIEERMNYNNEKMISTFYNNCIDNKIFVTPIGYAYMTKVRGKLLNNATQKEIPPIPIASNNHMAKREIKKILQREEKNEKEKEKMVKHFRISIFLNVILIFLVLFMFFIASTSDKPNIINYEKAIVNKYASWEEELSNRENVVREKELEYSIINEE